MVRPLSGASFVGLPTHTADAICGTNPANTDAQLFSAVPVLAAAGRPGSPTLAAVAPGRVSTPCRMLVIVSARPGSSTWSQDDPGTRMAWPAWSVTLVIASGSQYWPCAAIVA